MLGPILFLIFINDSGGDLSSKVLKFAKVFRTVKSDADKETLQDDLTKLTKWSENWLMLFNFGKCKCIHIGDGNVSKEYFMGNTISGTSVKEKDMELQLI